MSTPAPTPRSARSPPWLRRAATRMRPWREMVSGSGRRCSRVVGLPAGGWVRASVAARLAQRPFLDEPQICPASNASRARSRFRWTAPLPTIIGIGCPIFSGTGNRRQQRRRTIQAVLDNALFRSTRVARPPIGSVQPRTLHSPLLGCPQGPAFMPAPPGRCGACRRGPPSPTSRRAACTWL